MLPLLQWESNNDTCYECVFLALGIHHKMHMCHIVICGLSGCTVFFDIILFTARFSGKKVIERIILVLIFSTTFVRKNFAILRRNW